MPQQIRCFVHCCKQVFLHYLLYAYFDILKISIVSPESSKLFQKQRSRFTDFPVISKHISHLARTYPKFPNLKLQSSAEGG